MKYILSALVIALFCFQLFLAQDYSDIMAEKQWADYKLQHNKNYEDPAKDAEHFEIFKNNLKKIEEHNAKYERGEVTYTMGINHMTDWTEEQKQKMMGARMPTGNN